MRADFFGWAGERPARPVNAIGGRKGGGDGQESERIRRPGNSAIASGDRRKPQQPMPTRAMPSQNPMLASIAAFPYSRGIAPSPSAQSESVRFRLAHLISTGRIERIETVSILSAAIHETPIAIVDVETTGLTAGRDRIVEISVVRVEPGSDPLLVLDTLVNPMRPISATEIHGITDDDVLSAPRFQDLAGEVVAALSGCVVAAYNVYFDMRFLEFELGDAGVSHRPPHFCLMYLRPMLGLGSRCKLQDACIDHAVDYEPNHVASNDALASAGLLAHYLKVIQQKELRTYGELASLRTYKFTKSFANLPFPGPDQFQLSRTTRLWSRVGHVPERLVDPLQLALRSYWDTLKTVIADLEISDEELQLVIAERHRLQLGPEQVRMLHARAFASVITQFIDDQWLDDRETRKLRKLHKALSTLGWAPGE